MDISFNIWSSCPKGFILPSGKWPRETNYKQKLTKYIFRQDESLKRYNINNQISGQTSLVEARREKKLINRNKTKFPHCYEPIW